jgi:hypothetical protein
MAALMSVWERIRQGRTKRQMTGDLFVGFCAAAGVIAALVFGQWFGDTYNAAVHWLTSGR